MQDNATRGRLGETLAYARDLAIVAAVLVYFVGYFYLYYYFVHFDVSMIATNIAPLDVFVYAYNVFFHQPLLSALYFAIAIIVVIAYIYILDKIHAQLDDPTSTASGKNHDAGAGLPTAWLQTSLAAAHVVAVILFLGCFPLLAVWARHVADADAATVFDRSHEGFPRRLHVIITQSGNDFHPTPAFSNAIREINAAGDDGRAILVGEDADRVFIFIGSIPMAGADPFKRLPGDIVLALQKEYVTVEDI